MREKAPETFELEVMLSRNTYDKLLYIEELLGHRRDSRHFAQVLELALEALIEELEKGKSGTSSPPAAADDRDLVP